MTAPLLSVAEAARAAGLSRDAMYALVNSRQINALRVGRKIHIAPAAVDDLIHRIATQGVRIP